MANQIVREAVGVFHDEKSLQGAADALMISGFDRSQLSILAGHRTIEKELGHRYERVTEIEDDPEIPRLAYIGSDSRVEAEAGIFGGLAYVGAVAAVGAIVASGGTIGAALVGAAVAGGAGGFIGAALARIIDRHHAHYLQEQLERGGILLWVKTEDAEHEKRALEILDRHSAEDVHVHEFRKARFDVKGGVSHDLSFMNRLGM
jgi:hypothetical protein